MYRALFMVVQNWKQYHILTNSLSSTFIMHLSLCSLLNVFYALLYKKTHSVAKFAKPFVLGPTHLHSLGSLSTTLAQTRSSTDTMAFDPHAFAHPSSCLDILPPVPRNTLHLRGNLQLLLQNPNQILPPFPTAFVVNLVTIMVPVGVSFSMLMCCKDHMLRFKV